MFLRHNLAKSRAPRGAVRVVSRLFSEHALETSLPPIDSSKGKVCVIGSGPSGMYTAKYILQEQPGVKVDVIERLPEPFGLVSFGVAPDQPEAKAVTGDFTRSVLEHPDARIFTNTVVAESPDAPTISPTTERVVSMDSLKSTYDAVVVAVGAESSRPLNLPNEALQGIYDAREFVGWYNGHPDYAHLDFGLDSVTDVVIIGNGNVALDCARILLKPVSLLSDTEIAPHARAALEDSAVQRITIAARRGPVQAAYTIAEFREISSLALRSARTGRSGLRFTNALPIDKSSAEAMQTSRALKRKTELLIELQGKAEALERGETIETAPGAEAPVSNARELEFLFWAKPQQFCPLNDPVVVDAGRHRVGSVEFALVEPQALAVSASRTPSMTETRLAGGQLFRVPAMLPPMLPTLPPTTTRTSEHGKYHWKPRQSEVAAAAAAAAASAAAAAEGETSAEADAAAVAAAASAAAAAAAAGAGGGDSDEAGLTNRRGRVMVIKSVGYRTTPVPGAPYDEERAVIPTTQGGRVVVPETGAVVEGLYASGWARRGPSGIIGTNIADAKEVAAAVVEDLRKRLGEMA